MRYSIIRILLFVFVFSLTWYLNSSAVCLTPEVVEKLRKEGRLEEWVSRWESAAKRGMYETTPDQLIRLAKRGFAVAETLRPLVLCVDFSDNESTYTTGAFDTLLFSKDFEFSTGSFRDYYLENSYGQHDPQGGVYGWVRVDSSYAYYTAGQNGLGTYPRNAQKLVQDALDAADPYVNFADYDYDGDLWIDGLIVVHAGPGAEETGDNWHIWSHMSSVPTHQRDGIGISSYTIQPEVHANGSLIDIGVFCHEWGHFLGIHWEEYDRNYSSWGLGDWSVMASGCYNNGGKKPAHHSAYCKYYLGWTNVDTVQSNQTNVEIIQAETSPVSYRLWTSGLGGSQFFMVENRQKAGFDSHLPGSGLLIYHVDVSKPGNDLEWCPGGPASSHFKTALEQADGMFKLEGCYGDSNRGDWGDPFPGSQNKRAFDDTTTPSSRDYYDNSTQVAVWNISNSDSVMYANLDVTWSRPCLFLDSFTVDDSPPGGDGDGRPEAGEAAKIYFTISNIWLPISGTAVTASADTAGINFTDDYSYLGYIGTGDFANNSSDPIEFEVDPLFPGRPTIFTLHVEGNTTSGIYTLDFEEEIWAGDVEILIVDDAGDYQSYYTGALDSLRQIYEIWDAHSKGDPDFSFNKYRYLIWYTGDHKTDLFTQAQVESLMSFLDNGGGLFLTSQDAVEVLSSSSDPWDTLFLKNYLHVGYDGNNIKHLVAGRLGGGLEDTLWIRPEKYPGAQNQTSKDNLVPDSEADVILVYADGGWTLTDLVAGTKYLNDIFRVVVFGFGFEAINSSGDEFQGRWLTKPHVVMERVLNWLRGSSDVYDWGEEFVSLPKAIQLYQNYPNPFNPVTSIQYTVGSRQTKTVDGSQFMVHSPVHTTHEKAVDGSQFMVHSPPIPTLTVSRKAADGGQWTTDGGEAVDGSRFIVHSPIHTTLKIYNLLGQVVRILVNEEKLPGSYTVIWDGRDQKGHEVSSGIYFYQLKTKDYSEVKKMVLLK